MDITLIVKKFYFLRFKGKKKEANMSIISTKYVLEKEIGRASCRQTFLRLV